ncbi:rab-like protein 5, putative, partial [Ichthyophthirius multifiliis]
MSDKQRVVKILVIGPIQSGKSSISNFLGQRSEVINKDYRPTAGVRIVEFNKEAPVNPKRPGQETASVQLWDVSGDSKYDQTWPAIQKNCQGCILVFNAENPKHEQEIEAWVNAFPKKCGIQPSMLIAFSHFLSGKPVPKTKQRQIKGLPTVSCYNTSIEEGAETIHPAFDKFFNNLMMNIYEKEEQLENNLIYKY